MRLESALYSSKAGIDIHGQAISVIGDNVSNTNTIGFKRSRAEFSSMFPGGPEGDIAEGGLGTGSGGAVSVVRQIYEGGIVEPTSRALDTSIIGRGFFTVGTPEDTNYTRAGNLEISADGFLSTVNGDRVLGYLPGGTELSGIDMRNFAQPVAPSTEMSLFGNLDSRSVPTIPPAAPQRFSEVNSAASFVAYQEAYDSLGERHGITLAFFRGNTPGAWTARAYVDGGEVGGTPGVPQAAGADTVLQFQGNGSLVEGSASVLNLTPAWSNGANASAIAIDLNGFSQYATASALSSATVNGNGVSGITGYEISDNGDVNVQFDTGVTQVAGTIALTTFVNEEGLTRRNESLFAETLATGERTIGRAGEGVLGSIRGNSLERSNADISTEFVELTLMQRGYQANSQALSTVSELLRDTIQLMR